MNLRLQGRGIVWEFGKVTYTLLDLKWVTFKDLPYSMWSSAQRYMQPRWEGDFGKKWINAYMWLSLFAAHLKRPQYLPQYKKKIKQ